MRDDLSFSFPFLLFFSVLAPAMFFWFVLTMCCFAGWEPDSLVVLCSMGGGGGGVLPNMVGDARDCPRNRWPGGPVRSGDRAGLHWTGLAGRANRWSGKDRFARSVILTLTIWVHRTCLPFAGSECRCGSCSRPAHHSADNCRVLVI